MPTSAGVSYLLLLGDFAFYLALYAAAVFRRHDVVSLWGSLIAIPSFVLWFAAKLQLGSSFTARPEARALVIRGLYSKIQHPIYLFSTMAIFGTAICLRSVLFNVYVVAVILFQLYRARLEARVLREKFGSVYEEYRAQTWF